MDIGGRLALSSVTRLPIRLMIGPTLATLVQRNERNN